MVRAAWLIVAILTVSGSERGVALAQLSTIEHAVRVDAVQVVVGSFAPGPNVILILQSDVELRARLSLLRGAGAAAALGPLSTQLLRATQQELLSEALIASEAQRLSMPVPGPGSVQRERQRLVTDTGGTEAVQDLFRRLGVSSQELDAIASRRVAVADFLSANLTGVAELTPGELERSYASAEHPFKDRPFAEVRDALRAFLGKRALEDAVSRWIQGLKERVPHRVLVAY